MMLFDEVSSRKIALNYLEKTMLSTKKYRIGGHSKGGNLAVYASVMCEPALQKKIIEVYSNDGPGFSQEMLEKMPFFTMENKIKHIIPKFSTVGSLFNNPNEALIVESNASALMQHDGASWLVEKDHFISVTDLSPRAKQSMKVLIIGLEMLHPNKEKSL